jgi:glycosyltransferase involved in cell wall biosynthesis
MHLEALEQGKDAGPYGRRAAITAVTTVLNEQLRRADYVLCASEKQRDLWLGHLAALGRVNAATYDADPSLRSLIDVVPFGVADEPPHRTGAGIRGVVPGVNEGDRVVLWGGGIYNWFDPVTLLHAIDCLRHEIPNVRLVFMGVRHPNPEIPEMRAAGEARAVARELGLDGTHVFFNEGWVPYSQRQNHLLDADVGVSTHRDDVEAAFSFRTRVLDYFWCRLPVVVTSGDWFGDLVTARELGLAVAPGDVEGLANALRRVLTDAAFVEQCRRNIDEVVQELRWTSVLSPLLEFCRAPHRAADLVDCAEARWLERPVPLTLPPDSGVRGLWNNSRAAFEEHGWKLVVRRLAGRMARAVGLRRPL